MNNKLILLWVQVIKHFFPIYKRTIGQSQPDDQVSLEHVSEASVARDFWPEGCSPTAHGSRMEGHVRRVRHQIRSTQIVTKLC